MTGFRILAGGRSFPCHPERRVRFDSIMPCRRKCPTCATSYDITFETAIVSRTVGAVVHRAIWTRVPGRRGAVHIPRAVLDEYMDVTR